MLKNNSYPVNDVSNLEESAGILSCNMASLPTAYVALRTDAKLKSVKIRNGVTERMEKRLATWQSQCQSLGGRLTVITGVLDSIPIYIMSLFHYFI